MTIHDAIRILREQKHRGNDNWTYDPHWRSVVACPDPFTDRLTVFEVIAIAKLYEAGGITFTEQEVLLAEMDAAATAPREASQ